MNTPTDRTDRPDRLAGLARWLRHLRSRRTTDHRTDRSDRPDHRRTDTPTEPFPCELQLDCDHSRTETDGTTDPDGNRLVYCADCAVYLGPDRTVEEAEP